MNNINDFLLLLKRHLKLLFKSANAQPYRQGQAVWQTDKATLWSEFGRWPTVIIHTELLHTVGFCLYACPRLRDASLFSASMWWY